MKKAKIYIITKNYPYGSGEEFIETEIKYWSEQEYFNIILLPMSSNSYCRRLPGNITLDKSLIGIQPDIFDVLKNIFSMFKSQVFYREKRFLFRKPFGLITFIYHFTMYKKSLNILKIYLKNKDFSNDIFYTYWFRPITHALETLSNKYRYQIITRAHGYDLYEKRSLFKYMPLKRQMSKNLNKIFANNIFSAHYLQETYLIDKKKICISRLGVENKNIISMTSKKKYFNIVSCSYLTPVKRVDKIIDAIKLLCVRNIELRVSWNHIGTGKMLKKLKKYAYKTFHALKNLNYSFLENYTNNDVFNYYKSNPVDVFVNASDSEGTPVSIMEALSCCIPVIAPDLGGIREQVGSTNGVLLKENFSTEDLTIAFEKNEFYKSPEIRKKSYDIYKKKFDSATNYPNFIQEIRNM